MVRLARPHLFAWYRVLPMLIVAIFGVVSFLFSFAPAPLLRLVYPLSYESQILESCSSRSLDPYLVAAVIKTESGWDASATSDSGARGLMQLMPETSEDMVKLGLVSSSYDPENLEDPATNIEFGCAYLAYLISYFNGSTDKAIAAYNAGMGYVEQWTQSGDTSLEDAITFPETQAYLARVTNAQERYESLYPQAFN